MAGIDIIQLTNNRPGAGRCGQRTSTKSTAGETMTLFYVVMFAMPLLIIALSVILATKSNLS